MAIYETNLPQMVSLSILTPKPECFEGQQLNLTQLQDSSSYKVTTYPMVIPYIPFIGS